MCCSTYIDDDNGSGRILHKIEMEVDLRSDDKQKRLLYFFREGKFINIIFKGLPESVKFSVYFFY